MKYILLALYVALVTILVDLFAIPAFQQEMANAKAESVCIGKYISQEIPRKDIATFNGKCWLK